MASSAAVLEGGGILQHEPLQCLQEYRLLVPEVGVGNSRLHVAARLGRHDMIAEAVAMGEMVNVCNFDGVTPLHEACAWGQTECALTLLLAGADVNARNIDAATPLCDASSRGSIDCVRLLLERGASINPWAVNVSPLHEAMLAGRWEVALILIAAGAELEKMDCHFGTPLHVAASLGDVNSVKVLLNSGANVNATKINETALHMAARKNDVTLISLLLEYGADAAMRNNTGQKPRDLLATSKSDFQECAAVFSWYESHPKTLLQICRLSIRRCLGLKGLSCVQDMHLPSPLKTYLQYGQCGSKSTCVYKNLT
ncbi:ankyrin repeat and SOCS box protein 13 isoform X1 [Lingula anatina]|uniref:Ankyrin repeat and SOCS box protein 13 isoform X1 n=1 Tax=Lingula anatina TaxID=7574 RepID=A0A1S3IA92_LINAN|nr:ankyrin repeat and SOCS box protein 13 isoform X1 [Lingula anatina]|eukprot:XP_013395083.1 ankyrin repeat and SOCS box protein 13 isoform X1 [Lingula anatina]